MRGLPADAATAMILILLIVVPCILFAITLVAVLDRVGVLSHLDEGSNDSSSLLERVPRPALVGAMTLMGAWMLVWVVVLLVGLGTLSA